MEINIKGNVLVKHINYKDCDQCNEAEVIFRENKMPYATIIADKKMFGSITRNTKTMSVPQILIDGELIGGLDELKKLID